MIAVMIATRALSSTAIWVTVIDQLIKATAIAGVIAVDAAMAIAHPVEELLTTADAARIAGVVPDTLRLWQRLGKITAAFRTPTGIRLYRRSDIERMVDVRAHEFEHRSRR